jgi:Zn-dependent protease
MFMFTKRWQLFRILGIPINVDLSWLIILLLLTWTLANEYAATLPDLTDAAYWTLGLVTAMGFFLCIVLHELSAPSPPRANSSRREDSVYS